LNALTGLLTLPRKAFWSSFLTLFRFQKEKLFLKGNSDAWHKHLKIEKEEKSEKLKISSKPSDRGGDRMKKRYVGIAAIFITISIIAGVVSYNSNELEASVTYNEKPPTIRVTVTNYDHTVEMESIIFSYNGHDIGGVVYTEPLPKCTKGGTLTLHVSPKVPVVPNDVRFRYKCDGGPLNHYRIPDLKFGKSYTLTCPTTGEDEWPKEGDPPGDAIIVFELIPNIVIARPYMIHDLETDEWISNPPGKCIVAWQPGTTTAIFFAFARSNETYIFSLTEVFNCTDYDIWGRWNVMKDGRFVCERCIGHAYGLDTGVGNYFKLYIGNQTSYYEGWHFSGWILRSRVS